MRFVTFFLICGTIGAFLWQSIDIGAYREHHAGVAYISPGSAEQLIFLEEVDIIQSPQKEDWLIAYIEGAKKEIKVALYMFTVPSLRDSLLRAKNRGVDVRVILEKNPYNATSINRETIQFLEKNTISFHETDTLHFSFMHAKYILIDELWIISTANWTRSSFSSNREFFILGRDPLIWKDLRDTFEKDFGGKEGSSDDARMIIGPTNARERIVQFIHSTTKEIHLYMPSISDGEIIAEFQKACLQGKMIYILLDKNEENTKKGNTISQNGCPSVRIMKTPSLHGKALIIDKNRAFIGSFNFTQNSLENNREIGIFINGKSIGKIVNIFDQDWKKSVAF